MAAAAATLAPNHSNLTPTFYEGWQIPPKGSKAAQVITDFQRGDYKLYGLWGAVSSGKTVATALAWAWMVSKIPKHYPLAAIGKTERSLEGNLLDPLAEFLGPKNYAEKHGRGYVFLHSF